MGQSADGLRRVTADLSSVDDSRCNVLHVDMDAFFAAVELRRRPELRGRPMMVAGDSGRGVVLSATYEARRFGVRSAMPTGRAKALCPGIVVVPPDHSAYQEASSAVMALFADVTPLVEPLSVDEAFLDVAGVRRLSGRPVVIAQALRRRIAGELGLTATVGAASTKFIAKLASGLAKPNGLLVVPPSDVRALLDPLPVRALWGVGPKTAAVLEAQGLLTVGSIAATDRVSLSRLVGAAMGQRLHALARGVDERSVEPDVGEASIGAETTFDRDLSDRDRLGRELLALAERTGRRARAAQLAGRVIVLKVRYADFTTVARSVTLDTPTAHTRLIHRTAGELLDRVGWAGRRVRLLGVRLEGLVPAAEVSEQLQFGSAGRTPEWPAAESAADLVSARFGAGAVRPASLFGPSGPRRGPIAQAESGDR